MRNAIKRELIITGIVAVIAIIISVVITIYNVITAEDTDYSKSGFSITLPDTFKESNYEGTTMYLYNTDTSFTATKEEFNVINQNYPGITEHSSLDSYARYVLRSNQKSDVTIQNSSNGKYCYYSYSGTEDGKTSYILGAVFKSSDAFWICNLGCDESKKSKYEGQFLKWYDTVQLN